MTKTKTKNNKKSVRLDSDISPISYDLTLTPDLESFTFSGKETITIQTKKERNNITLHSKDIDIETVKSISGKNEEFATKITYNIEKETSTFYFKNKIKKGKCKLVIVFSGIIGENLRGFYKSKYFLNGEEKYIATTQFEATDARRAFPSFDEPAHKAVFNVSLVIPESHTAISNTLPIHIQEHHAGYKIVSFAPTPRMSTYLLAFIVGEFEYIEGYTKDKVLVRVFTTNGKKHQAKFALDIAIKSLEYYNDYFGIPYPLDTLDLIAIPDFESAAMENWGAITFRETAILIDEEHSSLSNKQWVAIVIAHEIAHQWFGNLVTMRWWTDLWLNEGFASYMENLCINTLFPHWHVWDLFISDRYAVALRLDALSNSHPIEITVNHPNEINEIFDMVSYAKGSAMIRQLAEFIGPDKFREGLQHYLKKHSYKNTDTVDLWKAFEKVSKKPITKMMSSWTKQTGYPLLSLTKNKDEFYLSQERFFSSRISSDNYKKNTKNKNVWHIPVKYESLPTGQAGNNGITRLLMTKKSVPLISTSIGKVNKEEETFTRVRYDELTLQRLSEEMKDGTLSTKDRLGIIRDLFALSEGGYISTDVALEFALNYKNEDEYIVWVEIAGGIGRVYNLIADEEYSLEFRKYALSLFSPLAKQMGFNKKKNEKHSDTFLRSLALSQSAFYGDKEIIKEATEIFKTSKSKIHADIRSTIYNIVARNGSTKEWNLFEKLYKEETLQEEKDRLGHALASFKDENLIKKTLSFIFSDNVKDQDAPFLLGMVWQKKEGRYLAWQFVKNNWKIILKKYGEGGMFISKLISPLGNHTKLKDLQDAKKFFAKNPAPGAERTLEQAYERIESNAAWLRDDKKYIKNWITKNF
ncbi:MAG TPA: M1 family metallopeptidase [Candidatus Paceibacterota bacterium]|nr:M1 family metallopeptidase [Candidatus Paceibacterota bacterium]